MRNFRHESKFKTIVGGRVTRYLINNDIVQVSRLNDVFHFLQCEGGSERRSKEGSEEGGEIIK